MKNNNERIKKIVVWILIGLAAIAFIRIVIFVAKSVKKPATLIYNVSAVKLARQQVPHYLAMQGVVEGDPQVKAFPQVPGKFYRNAVAEGTMVAKGQDIVMIDRDMVGYQYQLAPVKAPVAGIVTRLYYIDRGDSVSPAMPVAEVANEEAIKVVFNVGQEELVQIAKGQKAKISFIEDPSLFVDGEVFSVPPVINSEIMAGTVVVKADNKDKKLKLGMSVNVDILAGSAENFLVPERAVLMGDDKSYVYINVSNTAKQVNVTTGYRVADSVEIVSADLKEGDEVLIDGAFKLAEGAKVDTSDPAAKNEKKKGFFGLFGKKND